MSFNQSNNKSLLQNIKSKLSSEFDDKYPFLLFPVRIETRFMDIEYPTTWPASWTYSPFVSASLSAFTNAKAGINTYLPEGPFTEESRQFINETFASLAENVTGNLQNISELVVSEKFKLEVEADLLIAKMRTYANQAVEEKARIDKGLTEMSESDTTAQAAMSEFSSAYSNIEVSSESLPAGNFVKFSNLINGLNQQMDAYKNNPAPGLDERRRALGNFIVHAEKLTKIAADFQSLGEEDSQGLEGTLLNLNSNLSALSNSLGGVSTYNSGLSNELGSAASVLQYYASSIQTHIDGLGSYVISTGGSHVPDGMAPGFMSDEAPIAAIAPTKELWVRIYPDDVMIDGHDEELTQGEIDAGQEYWENIWAFENDQDTLLSAWNKLVKKYGANRAAWVVKVTTPNNLASRPSGTPGFDPITAATSMGSPAKSYVMPDRFVVVAYDSMNSRLEWVGSPVDDPLTCGIDPSATGAYAWDTNGDLTVDQNIKWMTDFDEAYTKGMALRVPLENGFEENGFKRLYVLGLRLNEGVAQTALAHASDGKTDLETLIDSHHYAYDGFSLMPIGTATNNTSDARSPYRKDDPGSERSFGIEVQEALFDIEANIKDKADGQWFSEALGINHQKLSHIEHADGYDVRNALLMNRALWPATMGFYLEHMLDDLFMKDDMSKIDGIRDFFEAYVSARGFVPSFRVSNQPYGILPTTAYSKWEQNSSWSGYNQKWESDYLSYVNELESYFWNVWLATDKIAHIHKEPQGSTSQEKLKDSQANFLNILGLNPTSIEHFYRYGISDGSTGHALSMMAVIDPAMNTFLSNSNMYGLMTLFYYLKTNNPMLTTGSRLVETVFMDKHYKLNGPLVDLYKTTKDRTLRLVDGKNYIEHLLDSSVVRIRGNQFEPGVGDNSLLFLFLRQAYLQQYYDSTATIFNDLVYLDNNPTTVVGGFVAREDDPDSEAVGMVDIQLVGGKVADFPVGTIIRIASADNPANNGYFGIREVADDRGNVKITVQNPKAVDEISSNASVASTGDFGYGTAARKDQHKLARFDYAAHSVDQQGEIMSPWKLMLTPFDNWADFPGVSMEPAVYLAHYLDTAFYSPGKYYLKNVKDALNILKDLSTADLECAFTEHLDLCSYRLDSWKQGVVNQRLRDQRAATSEGIYLGAFAWVEDLTPSPLAAVPVDKVPEGYANDSSLKYDIKNQGYIHSPSVAHATAAAVLRSGYNAFSSNSNDEQNIMSVNLSSERVRKAKTFMEGIRNGQDMSALLGYQFERGLKDLGTVYNNYIYSFREVYPASIDPQELQNSGATLSEGEPNVVVDGLKLIQDVSDPDLDYPYGVSNLPTTGVEKEKIILEVVKMKDAMDAVADLAVSDSVYSAVLGNFDRSNAMTNAFANGKVLPETNIDRIRHKGRNLTHRVGLMFSPITSYLGSARAKAEPSLNKWMGDMMGDLANYRLRTYLGGATSPTVFTLSQLGLEPIDFLYLMSEEASDDKGTLTAYLARLIRIDQSLGDDDTVEIRYMERDPLWDTSIMTFVELVPLLKRIRTLVTDSRPLQQEDLNLSPTGLTSANTNPKGYNDSELRNRLTLAYDELDGGSNLIGGLTYVRAQIIAARDQVSDDITNTVLSDGNCNDLIAATLSGFEYNIANAVPGSVRNSGFALEDQEALVKWANEVLTEISSRTKKVDKLITDIDNGTIAIHLRVEKIIEAIKDVFGGNFKAIPHFTVNNQSDINTAIDVLYPGSGATFIPAGFDPVSDWLHGIGKVRDRMRNFEALSTLAENFDMPLAPGTPWEIATQPIQLYPAAQNGYSRDADGNVNSNEYWLGMQYPETFDVGHDALSICLQYYGSTSSGPAHLTGNYQCGLLVDEWNEQIPEKTVKTGVSFHYDNPDSKPPQSLLLCVTPKQTNQWEWEDLVSTLDETLENAKKRAVEPDHYNDTGLETVLPALIADIAVRSNTISLDFGENNDARLYPIAWEDQNGTIENHEAPRDSNGNII